MGAALGAFVSAGAGGRASVGTFAVPGSLGPGGVAGGALAPGGAAELLAAVGTLLPCQGASQTSAPTNAATTATLAATRGATDRRGGEGVRAATISGYLVSVSSGSGGGTGSGGCDTGGGSMPERRDAAGSESVTDGLLDRPEDA